MTIDELIKKLNGGDEVLILEPCTCPMLQVCGFDGRPHTIMLYKKIGDSFVVRYHDPTTPFDDTNFEPIDLEVIVLELEMILETSYEIVTR